MNIVAFDTETKGLDWFDPNHRAFLATTATKTGEELYDLSKEYAAKAFVEELDAADIIVAHNLPFDVHHVREATGYDILDSGADLHDTHIMAKLAFPRGAAGSIGSYGLKPLAKAHLGFDADEEQSTMESLAKEAKIKLKTTGGFYTFWQAYPSVLEKYALKDARITYDLFIKFSEALAEDEKLQALYELEQQVMPILIRAEQDGIGTDPKVIEELLDHYRKVQDTEGVILKDTLGDINYDSPKQLAEALQEAGVKLTRKTKAGEISTQSYVLQELEDDYPVVKTLGTYREASKMVSTYLEPHLGKDVLHGSFDQCGAWSGRMSSRRPNMQNFPRNPDGPRRMFVPRDGTVFVVADFDSIEIRLLAYYLASRDFIELIDGGHDPHAWMAAQIHGGTVEEFAKDGPNADLRSAAKNTLFAITYGAGGPRVADMNKISVAEARDLIRKIKASLPGYKKLDDRVKAKVSAAGHVRTILGRKQIVDPSKSYVGLNALIQGSAADVMKAALVKVDDGIKEMDARVLLVVHDEVVVEVAESEAEACRDVVVREMESAIPLRPRLKVTSAIVEGSYANAK